MDGATCLMATRVVRKDVEARGAPGARAHQGSPELYQAHADVEARVGHWSLPECLNKEDTPALTGTVVA